MAKNTNPSTSTSLTAKDMANILRNHYIAPNKPASGLFATEIGSPDGRRYADALWQSLTRSGGLLLEGHEIKVSRSDVAVEISDPTKAESWMAYCDKWWLVVSDPKLVEGFTIPDSWGIMAPPSGRRTRTMTILREAPLLKPIAKEDGLARLLAWYSDKVHKDNYQSTIQTDLLNRKINNLESEVKRLKTAGLESSYEFKQFHELYELFEKKYLQKIDKSYFFLDNDEKELLVDAMVDVIHAKKTAEKIRLDAEIILSSMKVLQDRFAVLNKDKKELFPSKD